jgi:predicted amidohydrolase
VATVASIQLQIPKDESKDARVQRAAALVESLEGIDLVVLPEIWNVGYLNFDLYRSEAEALDGPTITRMAAVARSIGSWILAGSIVERDGDDYYNTSVLLDRNGELAGTYRKIHLFGYGSKEPEVLTRGGDVTVTDTEFGRMGFSTCYDLRFPELFREMVDRGAEMFVIPSAWPYPRVEAWTALNRVRALENQAWLVSANCTGGHGYCGRSMIVDPWGTAVASASDRPAIVRATVDVDEARNAREEFPLLRDRVLVMGAVQ